MGFKRAINIKNSELKTQNGWKILISKNKKSLNLDFEG